MKYRKKPIVIEAIQNKNIDETANWPSWIMVAFSNGVVTAIDDKRLFIKTREGNHIADYLDYIIQGVQGELYPCKPDIFEQTYEAVE